MIVLYTNLKTGQVQELRIADTRCDELLDRCAAMMPPNPAELKRWQTMMAKRAAGGYDAAATVLPPPRRRR